MPEIEINGEKKKVACGPCIRGHRSSKCTHKDRVLIEVRKPGRPLSACPHPSGSCACERMVVNYTLPKTPHCGSCSSGPGSSTAAGSARIQKGKGRKPGSNLTPATLERAFSANGTVTLPQTTTGSATPISAEDVHKKPGDSDAGEANNDREKSAATTNESQEFYNDGKLGGYANDPPRTRLGMFGLGGVRARDEIGWAEPYPDMYDVPYERNGISRHLTSPDCDPPTAQNGNSPPAGGSCCAPRNEGTAEGGASVNSSRSGTAPVEQRPAHQLNTSSSAFGHAANLNGVKQGTLVQHLNDSGQPINPQHAPNSFREATFISAVADGDGTDATTDCNCGEGCACLACVTHPYNKTTLDYVRYHTDIAMRYNGAFSPSSIAGDPVPSQNGHAHRLSLSGDPPVDWAHETLNVGSGSKIQPSWHSKSLVQATPTQELNQLDLQPPRSAGLTDPTGKTNGETTPKSNGQHSSHAPSTPAFDFSGLEGADFDTNSPQQSGGTPTLSPSSFFLQSYTLPGCDDSTGTCQCGDGCTCVGCLTHTGHQNAQQQQAIPNSYASHGPGCACPHPEPAPTPNAAPPSAHGAAPPQQPPVPFLNGQQHNGHTGFAPQPVQSATPASTFTHIHGPTCACPVDAAVLQAQAQVQAHAQLHGPSCRCPTGMTYLTAQLQAEARLHQQLHGNGAPAWVGPPPG